MHIVRNFCSLTSAAFVMRYYGNFFLQRNVNFNYRISWNIVWQSRYDDHPVSLCDKQTNRDQRRSEPDDNEGRQSIGETKNKKLNFQRQNEITIGK